MASSELPRMTVASLGGAVKVFMMNHWHGQCQKHTATRPALQYVFWILGLVRTSCKSTGDN
jgi:hypothetical protein